MKCQGISWPTAANKLMQDFSLNEKELSSIYNLPHRITRDTKLKDLQFRIVNYIYNTNELL